MSGLQQVVAKFLAERDQVITAINNCPASNMEDYWRWQGNAEARRTLSQDLERDGIDLTTAPKAAVCAVCARPDVVLSQTISGHWHCTSCGTWWEYPGNTPASTDGIKAEAIRELAQKQRQYAADMTTKDGKWECVQTADWLDEQADAIDPARLEGAHP
jgi:ribosomal protein L37AE/L43A